MDGHPLSRNKTKNEGPMLWSVGRVGTYLKVVPVSVGNRSVAFYPTHLAKAPAENKVPEGTPYRHECENCPTPPKHPIAKSTKIPDS